MGELENIFAAGSGMYLLEADVPLGPLDGFSRERGFSVFRLDGRGVRDRESFLREAAMVMGFPSYFGGNWDGFEECVTDLGWRPANGYVVLYDGFRSFAEWDPRQWSTAKNILGSAVDQWSSRGVPFYVLLRG
jgi:hypothetical protein